jgi:hypothetical protein
MASCFMEACGMAGVVSIQIMFSFGFHVVSVAITSHGGCGHCLDRDRPQAKSAPEGSAHPVPLMREVGR